MRAVLYLFLLISFSFCVLRPAYAVSIDIDNYPPKVTSSEFQIHARIKGAKPATNYFKILLHQGESNVNMARTWNGTTWYDGSDGKQYFPLSVSHEVVVDLKAQLFGDIKNGLYFLSIRRYTASGNAADDTMTPVSVTVELPETTTEPSAIPIETPIATPAKTIPPKTPITFEKSPAVLSLVASPEPSPSSSPLKTPQVLETKNTTTSIDMRYFVIAIPLFVCGIFLEIYGALIVFKTYKQLV